MAGPSYRRYPSIWPIHLIFSLCCLPNIEANAFMPNKTDQEPKLGHVIAHCGVPQGNGGDWASTIAWMAEELMIKSELASQRQKDLPHGSRAGVDLACMLGGSSGSAATMILMEVLQNKQLGIAPIEEGIYDSIGTEMIARTLRVLAYSTDCSLSEQVKIVSHILTMSAIVFPWQSTLALFTSFSNRMKKSTFNLMRGNFAFSFFARDLLLARYLSISYVNMDMRRLLPHADHKLLKARGMHVLSDMAVFSGPKSPERKTLHDDQWRRIYQRLSLKIVKMTRRFLKHELIPRPKWKDISREAQDLSLSLDMLNSAPSNGFCTLTLVVLRDRAKTEEGHDILYRNMRPLVLCNRKTISMILDSKDYRHDILSRRRFASRFILGIVRSTRGAISPSIREPMLMEPLGGPLDRNELEISAVYDPIFDQAQNGINNFLLRKTDAKSLRQGGAQLDLEVIGGFADRRISAWILSYYHLEKMKALRNRGISSEGTMALFGIPDSRIAEKFDTYLIKNKLTKDPKDIKQVEANLQDWRDFQKAYANVFMTRLNQVQSQISTVAFNYDLTKVPAALARKGRYLIGKAANETRQALKKTYPEIDNSYWYYDPLADQGVVTETSNPRVTAFH